MELVSFISYIVKVNYYIIAVLMTLIHVSFMFVNNVYSCYHIIESIRYLYRTYSEMAGEGLI